MIDDTWQEDYGDWRFKATRFPDPKAMIDSLHGMGFKVMLWICPFVSPDNYLLWKSLHEKGALLVQRPAGGSDNVKKSPAMINWWNGVSAELDFTSPAAVQWFDEQLDRLVKEYGVDGFKFDAGDFDFYPASATGKKDVTANRHSELYAQFGLKYPLNEFRACWKMAGQPLAQRLSDKTHSWKDLAKLVPHMLAEGLVGYTFSCPDMIGGGEFLSFQSASTIDQDLVVRSAQCHALMPMMQFSVAPWRVLDPAHLAAVQAAVALRQKNIAAIMALAKKSAETGEPIVRHLAYVFPDEGFENSTDQFMLGDNLLVAPMLTRGTSRELRLPKGVWVDDQGKKYKGGQTVTIDVPLTRLPYFTRR